MDQPNILLVNPWIADFAAYDLWSKPLGLLYIGAFLRKYNYEISLLDFLDRQKWASNASGGRGKYIRTLIEKPAVLKTIPRNFALYGATEVQIREYITSLPRPSVILVTSFMNYWYVGVQKSVALLRSVFQNVPIILGGIYATLWKEHAHFAIDADYFVSGYGEKKVLKILDTLHGMVRDDGLIPEFDDSLFPPYDLYENPEYLPLMTSRGCPMNCSFCATNILNPGFYRRSLDNVLLEIDTNYTKYGVTKYAFYDDALFVQKEKFIKPLLREIIKRPQPFEFYSPNGLFAREIDEELAQLMKMAGFKVVRLSLESVVSKWQESSSGKVSREDFICAVRHLKEAGYKSREIEAYLIMGLPGQSFEDVRESLVFVYETGALSRLASFTPIPGTREWDRALEEGCMYEGIDPLLTNNSIYPCASKILTVAQFQELKEMMIKFNEQIRNPEQ
ncbi:MAG: radical SAM protein [Candidatus Marinimicrobia bacterium]|nr:radical SAM protein [Candidatus Neomarinimicrobiota bacterium]